LIVIDDGSSELPNYTITHQAIRVFTKENGGVSSARNLGVAKAKGELVLFLDSDDAYADDIFDVLDRNYSPDLDNIFFSYEKRFPGKSLARNNERQTLGRNDSLSLYFMKKIRVHICSVAINRRFLLDNKITFNETIHYSEDNLFLTALLVFSHCNAFLSEILYFHIIRDGSAMNKHLNNKSLSHIAAFDEILKISRKVSIEKELNFFIAACYANLIRFLIDNKTKDYQVYSKIIERRSFLTRKMKYTFSIHSAVILALRVFLKIDNISKLTFSRKLMLITEQ
jgi:UDP-glucose:(glucosyl)LPS beta-1,3-glucosyltransferase